LISGAAASAGALLGCATQADGGGTVEPTHAATDSAAPKSESDRFASLQGFCDGIPEVGETEFEERQERARGLAKDNGFDAVVMEAGVNLGYFTGVRWGQSERPLLLLIPVDGDPIWVGPAFEEGTLRERMPSAGELHRWHEHESPYAKLGAGLEARGVKKGRVGVDPALRLFVFDGLERELGRLRFEVSSKVFAGCRMRKTDAELARLRRVNEATKASLKAASPFVQPGMTEEEIAGVIREAQQAAGLEQIWVLALTGPNAAFPHGTRNGRPLEDGDLILVDTGGALHGYRSDITRTWAVGKPNDEQRKAWDAVLAAQTAGIDAVRPGVECGAVDAAARKVIEDAGFGKDYESFTHRLGHGIGLQVHEEPYLVRGNELLLEPGMTFSDEPGIYLRGSLGVRLEDIVAVTKDGAEVFGPRPRSLDEPFG
jgi:Xaa-Pro dipeptidase